MLKSQGQNKQSPLFHRTSIVSVQDSDQTNQTMQTEMGLVVAVQPVLLDPESPI